MGTVRRQPAHHGRTARRPVIGVRPEQTALRGRARLQADRPGDAAVVRRAHGAAHRRHPGGHAVEQVGPAGGRADVAGGVGQLHLQRPEAVTGKQGGERGAAGGEHAGRHQPAARRALARERPGEGGDVARPGRPGDGRQRRGRAVVEVGGGGAAGRSEVARGVGEADLDRVGAVLRQGRDERARRARRPVRAGHQTALRGGAVHHVVAEAGLRGVAEAGGAAHHRGIRRVRVEQVGRLPGLADVAQRVGGPHLHGVEPVRAGRVGGERREAVGSPAQGDRTRRIGPALQRRPRLGGRPELRRADRARGGPGDDGCVGRGHVDLVGVARHDRRGVACGVGQRHLEHVDAAARQGRRRAVAPVRARDALAAPVREQPAAGGPLAGPGPDDVALRAGPDGCGHHGQVRRGPVEDVRRRGPDRAVVAEGVLDPDLDVVAALVDQVRHEASVGAAARGHLDVTEQQAAPDGRRCLGGGPGEHGVGVVALARRPVDGQQRRGRVERVVRAGGGGVAGDVGAGDGQAVGAVQAGAGAERVRARAIRGRGYRTRRARDRAGARRRVLDGEGPRRRPGAGGRGRRELRRGRVEPVQQVARARQGARVAGRVDRLQLQHVQAVAARVEGGHEGVVAGGGDHGLGRARRGERAGGDQTGIGGGVGGERPARCGPAARRRWGRGEDGRSGSVDVEHDVHRGRLGGAPGSGQHDAQRVVARHVRQLRLGAAGHGAVDRSLGTAAARDRAEQGAGCRDAVLGGPGPDLVTHGGGAGGRGDDDRGQRRGQVQHQGLRAADLARAARVRGERHLQAVGRLGVGQQDALRARARGDDDVGPEVARQRAGRDARPGPGPDGVASGEVVEGDDRSGGRRQDQRVGAAADGGAARAGQGDLERVGAVDLRQRGRGAGRGAGNRVVDAAGSGQPAGGGGGGVGVPGPDDVGVVLRGDRHGAGRRRRRQVQGVGRRHRGRAATRRQRHHQGVVVVESGDRRRRAAGAAVAYGGPVPQRGAERVGALRVERPGDQGLVGRVRRGGHVGGDRSGLGDHVVRADPGRTGATAVGEGHLEPVRAVRARHGDRQDAAVAGAHLPVGRGRSDQRAGGRRRALRPPEGQ